MPRPSSWILSALGALGILCACGGDSGNPTEPQATATPTPVAATATPVATNPPTTPSEPEVCEDCNPGPVASVGARVFYAGDKPLNQGGTKRCGADDPTCYDSASNNDVVFANEFVIFDVTPRNSSGQKCCRDSAVNWQFENRELFEHVVGSNKFQYRVYARRRGIAQVYVLIDGVRSSPTLNVQIR